MPVPTLGQDTFFSGWDQTIAYDARIQGTHDGEFLVWGKEDDAGRGASFVECPSALHPNAWDTLMDLQVASDADDVDWS